MDKINGWTIKQEVQKLIGKKQQPTKYFVCKCDCGREKTLNAYALINNKIGKCKCQVSRHSKDITGKTFGYWKVLKYSYSSESGGSITTFWECICKCGKIKVVPLHALTRKERVKSCGCSRKDYSKSIFESNYEKTDGCWEWKGVIGTRGYGKIGTNKTAHRESYKYAFGNIPDGMQVCHICDNRKCVNPSHLFLGSIGDNMKDKTSKNRQAKGSKIGSSILTEEIVLEIRKMRLSGKEYEEIANHFCLQWDLVRKICKSNLWTHVPLLEETKKMKQIRKNAVGSKCGSSKLNEKQVKEIKILLKQGVKGKQIAFQFNVDQSTICDIKQGRCWSHI